MVEGGCWSNLKLGESGAKDRSLLCRMASCDIATRIGGEEVSQIIIDLIVKLIGSSASKRGKYFY